MLSRGDAGCTLDNRESAVSPRSLVSCRNMPGLNCHATISLLGAVDLIHFWQRRPAKLAIWVPYQVALTAPDCYYRRSKVRRPHDLHVRSMRSHGPRAAFDLRSHGLLLGSIDSSLVLFRCHDSRTVLHLPFLDEH